MEDNEYCFVINGFEDLVDAERYFIETLEEMDLDPEFEGTITVRITYEE